MDETRHEIEGSEGGTGLQEESGSTVSAGSAPSRYERICELVDRALEMPVGERGPLLDAECAGDAELRREVEELLAADSLGEDSPSTDSGEAGSDVFDRLDRLTASARKGSEYPEQIGSYRILGVLGSGGMGMVFLAQQEEPVRRRVALKLIHHSLRSPVVRARFDAERNALARLSHPNVAQLHEAGRSDDGFPFFAMEHLPSAEPLTRYCDHRRLGIEDRLRLFIEVCRGVQHAHQKGVLHRDLKPSNVLVTEMDGRPLPKVIDFGLAKAFAGVPLTQEARLTGRWAVGTPEYMSPEARRPGGEVDTRSDIYSLGIVLYELLAGDRPRAPSPSSPESGSGASGSKGSTSRPSASVSKLDSPTAMRVAEARGTSVQELRQRLRGDLDWIVLRAVADEPERRYASASELAEDLDRHLADEPVAARPPTPGYLAGKLVRRHRGTVAASLAVLMALVIGLVLRTAEARRAQLALAESRELASFLVELFEEGDPILERQRPSTVRELIDRGARSIDGRFLDQPAIRARLLSLLGSIYGNLGEFERAESLLLEALELQGGEAASPAAGARDRSTTLARLAKVDFYLGRYPEAEGHYRRALELARETAGSGSAEAGEMLHFLAEVEDTSGDRAEAEKLYLEARRILESELEPDDSRLAALYAGYGSFLREDARFEEAEELLRRTEEIRRLHFGPDHVTTASTQTNLASLYLQMGRFEEAEPLYLEAARIFEAVLGEHPRLADTLGNLAELYRRWRRYDAAETHLQRSLHIRHQTLEDDHPDIAIALNNLGTLYNSLGRFAEAEEACSRALEIHRAKLRPEHPHIGFSAVNLGLSQWQLGRHEESERHLRLALGIWERAYGPEHYLLTAPLRGLGGLYRDQGRHQEAEALYRRILEIREGDSPAEDSVLRQAMLEYAELLRRMGQDEEAREMERRAGSEA
ncbi:MAG: tetratricopeptide repeat protein [Holophagales bacterium]|nr:tetratricopeptide repeat protein [Holophagales bacterium]